MATQIDLRKAAASRGEKRYLGSPCGRGHEGWRFTSNGCCISCARQTQSEIRALLKAKSAA